VAAAARGVRFDKRIELCREVDLHGCCSPTNLTRFTLELGGIGGQYRQSTPFQPPTCFPQGLFRQAA
jgi:hypothetical protein